MKLIVEDVENVEYLEEGAGDKKALYITGPFLVAEKVNKNGRVYPMGVLEREVARYTKELIEDNRAWGELNHPDKPTVNLDRVALKVVSLKKEGNAYIGKAKITESQPMGKLVAGLIREEGANLGVSSRGVGSLKPHNKGYQEVQEDYRLCVAADIVSDPSAPGAFVQGIMENVEWVYDPITGTWLEEKVDIIKRQLHTMTREQREQNALRIWEQTLRDIANLK